MSIDPRWVSAAASALTAAGVWFLWKQINLMKSQIFSDHDRSRREKAVDLCMEWSKFLTDKTASVRGLVDGFSKSQAGQLYKADQIELDAAKKYIVDACFEDQDDMYAEKNGRIIVSRKGASILRWHIIRYLNILESILSSRRHNIADRDIIKEEFKYLVEPKKGRFILENVRIAAGGKNSYPAVEEFVRELKKDDMKLSSGKKLL